MMHSPDLRDRTIIITGANAGIGKAAALELAARGATVIMACRSAERGKAARDDVVARTGNDRVELMRVDTASQGSIRQFAGDVLRAHTRVHALINDEHCRTVGSPRSSYDRAAQERLWDTSLALTGLARP